MQSGCTFSSDRKHQSVLTTVVGGKGTDGRMDEFDQSETAGGYEMNHFSIASTLFSFILLERKGPYEK